MIDKLVERAALIADWYEQGDPVGALPLPPEILELQRSLATLENLPYNPAIEESKRGLRIQIDTAIAQNHEKNRTGLQRNELLMELGDRGFWRSVSEDEKVRLYRMFVAAIWVDKGQIVGVDFL